MDTASGRPRDWNATKVVIARSSSDSRAHGAAFCRSTRQRPMRASRSRQAGGFVVRGYRVATPRIDVRASPWHEAQLSRARRRSRSTASRRSRPTGSRDWPRRPPASRARRRRRTRRRSEAASSGSVRCCAAAAAVASAPARRSATGPSARNIRRRSPPRSRCLCAVVVGPFERKLPGLSSRSRRSADRDWRRCRSSSAP